MALHRVTVFCILVGAAFLAVAQANSAEDTQAASATQEDEERNDSVFIEPGTLNNCQLFFLTAIYGYILYFSSNLISDGSEFLLLVPSVAGLVGSVVLPILGAIPDGMMTLVSGLGPDAQTQVCAGVGVMSGSTVMLLTFPWFIAVWNGRVPIGKDGKADYNAKDKTVQGMDGGITYGDEIATNAKFMLLTALLFFVVQGPAMSVDTVKNPTVEETEAQGKAVNMYAGIGILACIVAFCAYLFFCFKTANEDQALLKIIDGIKQKHISLAAALRFAKDTTGSLQTLLPATEEDRKRVRKILRPFFAQYDSDKGGTLDKKEFAPLLRDLGMKTNHSDAIFVKFDKDKGGNISFAEFSDGICELLVSGELDKLPENSEDDKKYIPSYGDDDEDQEEVPEDLADMPPAEQQKRIIFRASWMMAAGTALTLIFSDPLVDCLTEWGNRLDVSAFYVAFILAPFASNASELLSAYNYAVKKTGNSITTSLSTLVGAACMNNTFCLAVMYCLIYFKQLAWQFKAETISIVAVQYLIGILAIVKRTHKAMDAIIVFAMYPACLALVKFLEVGLGYD